MIGACWKMIADKSYLFHICNGDWIAFVCILSIVSSLGVFLYKKKNKKEETIIYLLLLIYDVFIIVFGYDIASLFLGVLLCLLTVLMLINPEGFIDKFIFLIKRIDKIIGLHARLKTPDELHAIINNNKTMMISTASIYFTILLANLMDFFSSCFDFDYSEMIIVGVIGLASYIVFMYNFLSKTKCWLLVLGVNILIGIQTVFTMYNLLNSIVFLNMFVLATVEIVFNLFMIGIIGVMLIFEIMNLDGDEKSKYFKMLLYTTLGYGILKIFLEFSFSYYEYLSMVKSIKNVIDSTLQVCFLGSLFAYAGTKLNETRNDYLDKG